MMLALSAFYGHLTLNSVGEFSISFSRDNYDDDDNPAVFLSTDLCALWHFIWVLSTGVSRRILLAIFHEPTDDAPRIFTHFGTVSGLLLQLDLLHKAHFSCRYSGL